MSAVSDPPTDPPQRAGARRRPRARVLVAAAVAVVLVAWLVVATVVAVPGGPLDGAAGSGRFAMTPGDAVTFQEPELRNTSGHSITLISAKPVDPSAGVEILGVRASLDFLPGDQQRTHILDGWPPTLKGAGVPWSKAAAPVDGFEIPSRGGGEPGRARLITGVRITAAGEHEVSWRITYRDRFGIRRVIETGGSNSVDTSRRGMDPE